MIKKLDRTEISFASIKENHKDEIEYWSNAPIEEKLEMITYLRECCYGDEATTGRLQRIFKFSKQK
jgi:hypothetical protein